MEIVNALPFGHAAGPGLERVCRELDSSKYCHNYLGIFDRNAITPSAFKSHNEEYEEANPSNFEIKNQFHQKSKEGVKTRFPHHLDLKRALESWTNNPIPISIDIDTTTLPKISEMLIQRHQTFEKLGVFIKEVVPRLNLTDNPFMDPHFMMGVWISQWWGVNIINAPFTPSGLPYQGICYPDACTKEDIQINNLEYAWKIYKDIEGSPVFAFSPFIPWKTTEEEILYE